MNNELIRYALHYATKHGQTLINHIDWGEICRSVENELDKHSWHNAVTDPPKKSGNYLVDCPACTYVEFFMGTEWYQNNGFITHWMPLPELPKEDK